MDRERIEALLRELDMLVDDPPALVTLVVQAVGPGMGFKHPMLLAAEQGSLVEAKAAMLQIRAQLVAVVADLDKDLEAIGRVSTRDTHNVVDSL
jgi:hypothetical protein